MVGPGFSAAVSISIMKLLRNFVKYIPEDKLLQTSAKLFPILSRRFSDADVRVSRQD